MPRYEITSPDGKKFEITAPDGASQDQVLSYAKDQFSKMPKEAPAQPSMVSNVLKGVEDMNPALQISRGVLHGLDTVSKYAGGAVTDTLASRPFGMSVPPEVSGAAGAAAEMVPGALLGAGGGRAAVPLLQKKGEDMMLKALKPSKLELLSGEGERAASTMLDEGRLVTEGGVEKLRDKTGKLNDELQAALKASGATVDRNAIAGRLQEVIAQIEKSTFTPQDRVKAVEKIYNDVLGNTAIPNQIPVALANKIKSGIYNELGDLKYMRMKSGAPITDAEAANSALARGAKEEISAVEPLAAPNNAKMSELINASDMAENRVLTANKRDPGGLAWLTHDAKRFLLMVMARDPAAQSALAQALYHSKTAAPTVGAGVGGSAEAVKNEIEKRGRR